MSLRFVCLRRGGPPRGRDAAPVRVAPPLRRRPRRRPGHAPTGRAPATRWPRPTRRAPRALDVELIEDELNTEHAFHPIANKLYAAADAERRHERGRDRRSSTRTAVFVARAGRASTSPRASTPPLRRWARPARARTGPGMTTRPTGSTSTRSRAPSDPPWIETGLPGQPHPRLLEQRARRGAPRRGAAREPGSSSSRSLIDERGHVPERGIDSLDQISLAAVLARAPGARRHASLAAYNYRITRRPG